MIEENEGEEAVVFDSTRYEAVVEAARRRGMPMMIVLMFWSPTPHTVKCEETQLFLSAPGQSLKTPTDPKTAGK